MKYYYTFTHRTTPIDRGPEHDTHSWRIANVDYDLDSSFGLVAFIREQETQHKDFFLESWKRLDC